MKFSLLVSIMLFGSLSFASDLCSKEAKYAGVAVAQASSAAMSEANSFSVSPNGGYYATKLSSDILKWTGDINAPETQTRNLVYSVHAQVSQGSSLIATVTVKADINGEDYSCVVTSIQPVN
ncbi:MAG: hypothetical protein ACRBBP_11090 [Bdellovibrionales bacterium]